MSKTAKKVVYAAILAFTAEQGIRAFIAGNGLSWLSHLASYYFWWYLGILAIQTFFAWRKMRAIEAISRQWVKDAGW